MGTRTYSRRGVLTAAGRRRAGLESIDIFGNALPGGTTPPPAAPVVPPAPVTPPEIPPKVQPPAPITRIPDEQTTGAQRVENSADLEKARIEDEIRATKREMKKLKRIGDSYEEVLRLIRTIGLQGTPVREQALKERIKQEMRALGFRSSEAFQTGLRANSDKYYAAEDKLEQLNKDSANAEFNAVMSGSPIDFTKKANGTGAVRPQGPMKIDIARMSPDEVVDKITKYIDEKKPSTSEFYTALFASMQHPNAAAITINGASPSVQNLTRSFYGIFDASQMKARGALTFDVKNSRGRVRTMLGSNVVAFYSPGSHKITMPQNVELSTVMHEVAHAIQSQFKVDQSTQKWAEHRIKGETGRRTIQLERDGFNLGSITAPTGVMYRDHVDNPYTLHSSGSVMGLRFTEVFSTGIDTMPTANKSRDKQLFMTFIRGVQDANGYHN